MKRGGGGGIIAGLEGREGRGRNRPARPRQAAARTRCRPGRPRCRGRHRTARRRRDWGGFSKVRDVAISLELTQAELQIAHAVGAVADDIVDPDLKGLGQRRKTPDLGLHGVHALQNGTALRRCPSRRPSCLAPGRGAAAPHRGRTTPAGYRQGSARGPVPQRAQPQAPRGSRRRERHRDGAWDQTPGPAEITVTARRF